MMPTTQTVRSRPASAAQRLLTVRQTSEAFGIPVRSIHDLIARGVLTYVRFPDARRIWLDRGDVEAAITAAKENRAIA